MRLRIIICVVLAAFLVGAGCYQYVSLNDNKLHVIFCDVGQGDAIFVRTPTGKNFLIDGGPNGKVIDCLHSHMPFWEHTIDVMILSHPHADHYEGIIDVVKNYSVKIFATEELSNKTQGYNALKRLLNEAHIKTEYVFKGDRFKSDMVNIEILAPTGIFIKETSPGGFIGEKEEFASVIPLITYGNTKILLTGDTQNRELLGAIKDSRLGKVSVLQVPHHGSKTGLTQEILDIVHPSLAVISVGAKNRYHHPAPSTINLIQKNNIDFKMTKDVGDIEIISNGKILQFP